MKSIRKWLFSFTLLIWLVLLVALIYAIVYAPLGSWAKQYAFVIVLFFITFSQVVKRTFRYSYKADRIKKH